MQALRALFRTLPSENNRPTRSLSTCASCYEFRTTRRGYHLTAQISVLTSRPSLGASRFALLRLLRRHSIPKAARRVDGFYPDLASLRSGIGCSRRGPKAASRSDRSGNKSAEEISKRSRDRHNQRTAATVKRRADFKTAATTGGFTINLFIFKFGTSHEKDVVNDVSYTYSLPTPTKSPACRDASSCRKLQDELAQTIQEAAKAVKASSTGWFSV